MRSLYHKIDATSLACLDIVYDGTAGTVNTWWITRISTPVKHSRKGYATMLLQQACEQADVEEATLILQVMPDTSEGGPGYMALRRWYKRFGFMPVKNKGFMKRDPAVTIRKTKD